MLVRHIAAFSDGPTGGNPAGVVICEKLPTAFEMQQIAADVGFSETVFAEPASGLWRVRYFSPETEVPFCGHATIALGAALAMDYGDGSFSLVLNSGAVTVEGRRNGELFGAALQSPPTQSRPADSELVENALTLFGYFSGDMDLTLPPVIAQAGATHLIVALKSRERLAAMSYGLDAGRRFMIAVGVNTISLVHVASPRLFNMRNPFASGGVYEDPATGAAAAAFAGYLRDRKWPHGGEIEIVQGEDMGARSIMRAAISRKMGSSIRVSGTARLM
jgi:PhzF family phenazine biosynthesis protein